MRPHTRTQCQDRSQCQACQQPGPPTGEALSDSPSEASPASSTSGEDEGPPELLDKPEDGPGLPPGLPPLLPDSHAPHGFMLDQTGTFLVPSPIQRPKARSLTSSWSTVSELGGTARNAPKRDILLVELPAEVLVQILSYLPFRAISQYRIVSRRFNELCSSILNTTFQKFQTQMLKRFHSIKNKMPRRESARRNHPLARESDIIETLHMRLTLLQMTFGKHIERKHVCFFAGEILDEVTRILIYIKNTTNLGRDYKVTDELFDLSTMAMEYFKDKLEPTLPDITYFAADFLDDIVPYKTPSKKRSQSGSTSNGLFTDSPCSSRASVADSAVSEPWFGSSAADDIVPTSNLVLRKSIKSIRKGMKRYNSDMGEVKNDLKSYKAKMETQTKQIQEYSHRLEDYDRKFEESTRKFQTLLTELNKCKTEIHFWRSKSNGISPSEAESVPQGSGAELLGNPVKLVDFDFVPDSGPSTEELKANPGQPPCVEDAGNLITSPNSPRPVTRGSAYTGPPSPQGSLTPLGSTRKRRLRHDDEGGEAGNEPQRKSLRGSLGKDHQSATSSSCTTRSGAKRPKVSQ